MTATEKIFMHLGDSAIDRISDMRQRVHAENISKAMRACARARELISRAARVTAQARALLGDIPTKNRAA